MPLIIKKSVSTTSSYGIWEITETTEELLSALSLSEEEKKYYQKFGNEPRRKQWLSYRHILKNLLDDNGKYHITYNEKGKPFLSPQDYHISVSHSGNKSVAIISKSSIVGIDIELMSEKIHKLKQRFMSEYELSKIESEYPTEYIYVYWSAKEALCKMIDDKSVIFNEELMITPFKYQNKGIIQARIKTKTISRDCELYYEVADGYMFVYSM